MTAGAGPGRRRTGRLLPVAIAAAGALAYLVIAPRSADLAAQVYRTGLFRREGFALWDGQWYGGHHVPGYSVLFPPVAAALGPRLAAALAAVASAGLFARIAHRSFAPRPALWGAGWFGAATTTSLLSGRLTFAFGLPFGLAALAALTARRAVLAAALGVVTSLASPLVGLFLALAAVASLAAGSWRRAALGVALAALAPIAVVALVFPEGGTEPFEFSAFWPPALIGVIAAVALPREHRSLRAGAALYAVLLLGAFLVPNPVGSNAVRLGALFTGPLAALALAAHRRVLLALVLPLVVLQWSAAVRDVKTATEDRSTQSAYYAPLLGFLAAHAGAPARVEIPFTRNHWEAAYIAPRFPLARGWERQLDRRDNALFYRALSPNGYRSWLSTLAVRWIALPDAPLDYSARAEVALLRHGIPGLVPVWRSTHWRVWEVRPLPRLAHGPATVTHLGSDSVDLDVARPGRVVVQVRFTPYWAVTGVPGCVSETPGGWTAVEAARPGPLRLVTRFAPGRIGAHGRRCD